MGLCLGQCVQIPRSVLPGTANTPHHQPMYLFNNKPINGYISSTNRIQIQIPAGPRSSNLACFCREAAGLFVVAKRASLHLCCLRNESVTLGQAVPRSKAEQMLRFIVTQRRLPGSNLNLTNKPQEGLVWHQLLSNHHCISDSRQPPEIFFSRLKTVLF